jgi:hypothetical protein
MELLTSRRRSLEGRNVAPDQTAVALKLVREVARAKVDREARDVEDTGKVSLCTLSRRELGWIRLPSCAEFGMVGRGARSGNVRPVARLRCQLDTLHAATLAFNTKQLTILTRLCICVYERTEK